MYSNGSWRAHTLNGSYKNVKVIKNTQEKTKKTHKLKKL